MDHIDSHLTTASQDLEYSPAIRASLALGKAHLNKYYNMTDDSEIYRIAMSKYSILGLFSIILPLYSPTPVPQTPVFLQCQLGRRVDCRRI
jgi:hypothetical protein